MTNHAASTLVSCHGLGTRARGHPSFRAGRGYQMVDSWLFKYPKLLSEDSHFNRSFEISDGASAKLCIKAMPTPYHDAVGRYMHSQTTNSVGTAYGRDPNGIGLWFSNPEFNGFGGPMYDGLIAPFMKKTPDFATLPKENEFPSVATEVGFTQTWRELFEDAKLWLYRRDLWRD